MEKIDKPCYTKITRRRCLPKVVLTKDLEKLNAVRLKLASLTVLIADKDMGKFISCIGGSLSWQSIFTIAKNWRLPKCLTINK